MLLLDTFGRVSCDAAFSSACQKYFSQDEDGKHIDAAEFDKAGCLERSGMRPGEQSIFCCDSEAETAALNDEVHEVHEVHELNLGVLFFCSSASRIWSDCGG